tara:strand:- start:8884 stop:9306 length:423 start_codon:yes stop_codon:yes gene_type:complete
MKLDQLRKIIREEVRAAVKEELQEVMNEAVKIASTPTNTMTETPKPKDSNLKWSEPPTTGRKSLDEMLAHTKANMNDSEYKSIGNYDSPKAPNFASGMANKMGLASPQIGVNFADIPGFDPAKAKAVLDASMKIKSNGQI